jgi:hypothetical protein
MPMVRTMPDTSFENVTQAEPVMADLGPRVVIVE